MTKKEFIKAVKESYTMKEVMLKLGMKSYGGNYSKFVKINSIKYNVDISHLRLRRKKVKRNKINDVSDDIFIEAVKTSKSHTQLMSKINVAGGGNRWRLINERIEKLNLDIQHFIKAGENFKGNPQPWRKLIPLENMLIKNSTYSNDMIKRRLLSADLLKYRCGICLLDNWNNKSIVLQLDHINGDNRDNRLENLRLLCPNCHSQTSTYCTGAVKENIINEVDKTKYCKGCKLWKSFDDFYIDKNRINSKGKGLRHKCKICD